MIDQSTLLQLRDLALILGVALVLVVGMGLYMVQRYRSSRSEPRSLYPEAQAFQGRGSGSVEAGELIQAQYRIDYQFPDGALFKVELIEAATGDSDLILLRSGQGIDSFYVENPGRHLFQIDAPDEQARWSFRIKPVGVMNSDH